MGDAMITKSETMKQRVREGVFPPQEYSGFQGSKTEDYIGTWRKDVAMKIVEELRNDGFRVHPRGRGPRKGKVRDSARDLSLKDSTHIAVYIRGADVRELPSTETKIVEEQESIKGITRLEALKKEIV